MPSNLATNPLATLMRGTASPTGPGNPAAGGGGALAQKIASLFAQQQQADPAYVAKQLTQMRQVIGELIPKTLNTMPSAANELSTMLRHLTRAIEAAQKHAQAQQVVNRPPIGFSAAQPTLPGAGGGSRPPMM